MSVLFEEVEILGCVFAMNQNVTLISYDEANTLYSMLYNNISKNCCKNPKYKYMCIDYMINDTKHIDNQVYIARTPLGFRLVGKIEQDYIDRVIWRYDDNIVAKIIRDICSDFKPETMNS